MVHKKGIRQKLEELGSRLGDISANVDLGKENIARQHDNLEMDIFASEKLLLEVQEFLAEQKRKFYAS